jgi:hypothetical protein
LHFVGGSIFFGNHVPRTGAFQIAHGASGNAASNRGRARISLDIPPKINLILKRRA